MAIDWKNLARQKGFDSVPDMMETLYVNADPPVGLRKVGACLGVSDSSLSRLLKELGLPVRPLGGANYTGSRRRTLFRCLCEDIGLDKAISMTREELTGALDCSVSHFNRMARAKGLIYKRKIPSKVDPTRERLLPKIRGLGYNTVAEFLYHEYIRTKRGKKRTGQLLGASEWVITRWLEERGFPSKPTGGPNKRGKFQKDSLTQHIIDRIDKAVGSEGSRNRTVGEIARLANLPPKTVRNALSSRRRVVRRKNGGVLDFGKTKGEGV